MSQSTNVMTKGRVKSHMHQQRRVSLQGHKQMEDVKCKHSNSKKCYSAKCTDRKTCQKCKCNCKV